MINRSVQKCSLFLVAGSSLTTEDVSDKTLSLEAAGSNVSDFGSEDDPVRDDAWTDFGASKDSSDP